MDVYPRLRIAGIEPESFVDGPGIRMTIFTQGCHHNCPGCQNPQTHDFNGGRDIDIEEIVSMLDDNPLLDGVTFSGGDPMDQAEALIPLARIIKERGLNLVIFTGYTYERLMELAAGRPGFTELLSYADILIDGPFIMAKKSLEIKFRGSSNQRIIDVPKSLVEGRVVLHKIQIEEMEERPDLHFG
ncbi:MAG: anaerobic ribonucleoside-triphosphate reductase activating protein [Fibrobacter sp.]|uniref:anaerobic ribonucleoside-triphosphate reductase activating protein n=1 Tax=Fibrobacter sp. TaxID=35828 RepID=UPI0025C73811|nr:anaerobic ribonucleoside-triphosphate reductase activating protein [Fibrobacter sp.]MBR4783884.1 anaerobic ribonucleoside-triphosphate reductase activating protein [Fibrobacter sp.]